MEQLDMDIPDSGAVFAFGKKVPDKFYIKNDSVISAACGEEHALVATSSGRLFSFGKNDSGQLGLGHREPGVVKPTCVKRLRQLNQKAVRVACGPTHSLVTTESGVVYGFGINNDGQLTGQATDYAEPVEIKHLAGVEVKDLAAGRSFSVVLTKQGEIFTWGSNEEGCLGCGADEVESRDKLVQVRLPDKAVSLSAGAYHCACVLANGQVFTWGETEGGKLGCPDSESKPTQHLPQLAPLPPDSQSASGEPVRARSVACGLKHTLVLTEAGRVFACGSGESGQLGLGTGCGYTAEFQPVVALDGLPVACISAGECHSACVTAEAGYLYTFGDALHGKLGPTSSRLGGHCNQHRPFRVTALKPIRARRVVCGNVLTLVLAARRAPGDPAAAESDEADDPLDSMSARSPRPLRKIEQAALKATGGAGAAANGDNSGGLLRRRSSRSRQKYREMTRSSGSLAQPPILNGDTFELIRPAMQGAPSVETTLKNSTKPMVSKTDSKENPKSEAISMFDQLLPPINADGVEHGAASKQEDEEESTATERLIKPRLERRPSQAKPISFGAVAPAQPEDAEDVPTADQQPAGAPVLLEGENRTAESGVTPVEASVAAAAAADIAANDQEVDKASQGEAPVADRTAEGGAAGGPPQQSDPVKTPCCGARKSRKPPAKDSQPTNKPEQGDETAGAATTEEAVVPSDTKASESAPVPEAPAIADSSDVATAGGTSGAVKSVGCGRSRRQKNAPPQDAPAEPAVDKADDKSVEDAVLASDAKAAESAPPAAEGDADTPAPTPKVEQAAGSGTAGAVKGVGCGRSRRRNLVTSESLTPQQQVEGGGEPVEEAVTPSDAKAAESAPKAEASATVPTSTESASPAGGGTSGAVKSVGCGRSRAKRQNLQEQQQKQPTEEPPVIEGEATAAVPATEEPDGDGQQPATTEAPVDEKKSKSCNLL